MCDLFSYLRMDVRKYLNVMCLGEIMRIGADNTYSSGHWEINQVISRTEETLVSDCKTARRI